jgi:hypothetical protein
MHGMIVDCEKCEKPEDVNATSKVSLTSSGFFINLLLVDSVYSFLGVFGEDDQSIRAYIFSVKKVCNFSKSCDTWASTS